MQHLIEKITKMVSDRVDPAQIKPLLITLQEHIEAMQQSNAALQIKVTAIESRPPAIQPNNATDTCPYCKQVTGVLEDIRPDKTFGNMGVKNGYYKCANPQCDKTYDKEIKS